VGGGIEFIVPILVLICLAYALWGGFLPEPWGHRGYTITRIIALEYMTLNGLFGITVEVRHGDTEMKIRRRQALHPPNMLVTTPETLQAILPGTRMQQHLSHVRYVIID
jgi:hypothetical protein